MYEIPKISNKIKALYLYVEHNVSDREGDSWIYGHDPTIKYHIDDFNKTDCEKLEAEIWTWKEEILVKLADPFLDISNPNLNGFFMYCKIFSTIEDNANEEYLIENITVFNSISKGSVPIDFYYELKNKIGRVNERLNGSYSYALQQIKLKIDAEV